MSCIKPVRLGRIDGDCNPTDVPGQSWERCNAKSSLLVRVGRKDSRSFASMGLPSQEPEFLKLASPSLHSVNLSQRA